MVIKSAFMQRRKTLINSLTNSRVFINKDEAQEAFKNLNLDLSVRAEELTLQQFANIANYLTIQGGKK